MIKKSSRLDGIGEYWFSKKLDEVRRLEAAGKRIVNLGIGSPDLAPSPSTIEAAINSIKNPKSHGYAPYRSSPELRRAMAGWYQDTFQVSLDPDKEVLPLLGSKEAILYLTLAFTNPGDEVLIPDPGYPAYTSASIIAGAKVRPYDLSEEEGWLPDLKALRRQDLKFCKIMWVNYPHMPTGTPGTKKLFEELVAFAKEKGIMLVNDNPYSLVLNREAPLSILQFDSKKDSCIEINSLSKAFNMAGWRVGLLAGSKEVVDAVVEVKSQVDTGMFTAVQWGAIAAIGNTQAWHEERNGVYQRRQVIAGQIFDVLGFDWKKNQVGMFIWARVSDEIVDIQAYLDRILYEAGVFLTPGFIFGKNGSRYVRSSLCANEEALTEALERVRVWKAKQGH